jgi:hypothetical protein
VFGFRKYMEFVREFVEVFICFLGEGKGLRIIEDLIFKRAGVIL